MDFFKSVFSDDQEDSGSSNSLTSSPEPQHHEPIPTSTSSNPNPSANPKVSSITNAWTFGSTLFKTLASKSESVIDNYRRDLEDFGSGLRKETAVIRQVASRVVKELPASLDAGATVAQRSLESVGEAVDNLGSTVTRIITHGKESILAGESDCENSDTKYSTSSQNPKPYSRLDAQTRVIQCDVNTYCEEPGDLIEYNEWKLGFMLDEKANEIDDLIEENGVVKEIYTEIVPNTVDHKTFWSRYFYKVYKIKKAEEVRAQLVKRAISGEEEEELTWDVDEDDYEENDISVLNSKNLTEGNLRGENDKPESSGDNLGVKSGDKGSSDGNDNGESCKDSDFSVVSSQNEEIGWDEIENIENSDDNKLNVADLRRRVSAAEEEDEELTWDVEDDDDESSGS